MSPLSGASSGSSQDARSSGSDGGPDLRARMERKRKRRMESNRESARRSRMRKQQHLDDLTTQVNRLRNENHQILAALNLTTQNFLGVEAENSVLRTQAMELENRLHALNEILFYMSARTCTATATAATAAAAVTTATTTSDIFSTGAATTVQIMDPWSSVMHMSQPIDLYPCF